MGPDGAARLKVFFWNNLVGRFTRVDAPEELQYAAAHRNSPGKYLFELPLYLAPWTLLVIAALRRAWLLRKASAGSRRAVRFALAASLPPLLILSMAATARNVYAAPALPGVALLLAWWSQEISIAPDRWDLRSLRATSALLLLGVAAFTAALSLVADDAWSTIKSPAEFMLVSAAGLIAAAVLALRAWAAARDRVPRALCSLFLAYSALLAGPASQIYRQVDSWQDLPSIARAIQHDAADRPLILFAPDETTRAMIDMYARTSVGLIPGPIDAAAIGALKSAVESAPQSLIVAQLPAPAHRVAQRLARALGNGQAGSVSDSPAEPAWAQAAGLRLAMSYSLRNGRRYGLLQLGPWPLPGGKITQD
jgi:4-amino-4-deoxy-L-arabinose transferase-like glycosyltransferase